MWKEIILDVQYGYLLYTKMDDVFDTSNDFLFHLETGVQRNIEVETWNDDVSADSDSVSVLLAP